MLLTLIRVLANRVKIVHYVVQRRSLLMLPLSSTHSVASAQADGKVIRALTILTNAIQIRAMVANALNLQPMPAPLAQVHLAVHA